MFTTLCIAVPEGRADLINVGYVTEIATMQQTGVPPSVNTSYNSTFTVTNQTDSGIVVATNFYSPGGSFVGNPPSLSIAANSSAFALSEGGNIGYGTTSVQFTGIFDSSVFSVNGSTYSLSAGQQFTSSVLPLGLNTSVPLTISVGPITEPSDREISVLNSFLSGLQSTAQQWTTAIADYRISGTLTALENFFTSTVESNVSSAISRFGGVLISAGQGALDPAVASGVQAIYNQAQDPNTLLNSNERNAINQIFQEMDCVNNPSSCGIQPTPTRPSGQNGSSEQFHVPVQQNTIQAFDPQLASGYEYRIGSGDPNFASVVLPSVGSNQAYEIEVLENGAWIDDGTATPWTEYIFSEPGGVSDFRVVGINVSGVGDLDWVSGLSFETGGMFTGTITSLEDSSQTPAPEPRTLFGVFIGSIFLVPFIWRKLRNASYVR